MAATPKLLELNILEPDPHKEHERLFKMVRTKEYDYIPDPKYCEFITYESEYNNLHTKITKEMRIIVDWSEMGAGKTEDANKITKMKMDSYTGKFTSVYTAPRRTFTDGIIERLKMGESGLLYRSYMEKGDINNFDHIVIQAESFHKDNLKRVLVIGDEIRACLRQMDSPFHKQNFHANRQTLICYIQNAEIVLVMDANINETVIEFLHSVVPNEKIYVFRNTIKKKVGYEACFIDSEIQFNLSFSESIANGEKIALVSNSKCFCEKIEEMYLKDKGVEYVMYVGDSDQKQKSEDMRNLNETWKSPQVVMHTTTLTVGLQYNPIEEEFLFDKLYVYACNTSGPVLDIIQMMGRIRKLKRKWVGILCPTVMCKNIPLTLQAVIDDHTNRVRIENRSIVELGPDHVGDRVVIKDRMLYIADPENIWNKLSFRHKLEINQSKAFMIWLLKYFLKEQGYNITQSNIVVDEEDEKEFHKLKNEAVFVIEEHKLHTWINAPTIPKKEMIEYETKKLLGELSEKETTSFYKSKWVHRLKEGYKLNDSIDPPDPSKCITSMQLYDAQDYYEQFNNLHIEINFDKEGVFMYDQRMKKDIVNTAYKAKSTRWLIIRGICIELGLKNTSDRVTLVEREKIETMRLSWPVPFSDLKQLFDIRTLKPPDTYKSFIAMINCVFKDWTNTTLINISNAKDSKKKNNVYQLMSFDKCFDPVYNALTFDMKINVSPYLFVDEPEHDTDPFEICYDKTNKLLNK